MFTSAMVQLEQGVPLDFGMSALELFLPDFGRLFEGEDRLAPETEVSRMRLELLETQSVGFRRPQGERYYEQTERLSFGHAFRSPEFSWEAHNTKSHVKLVEAVAQRVQIHHANLAFGEHRIASREPLRRSVIDSQFDDFVLARRRLRRREVLGIAPVQWFGPAFVEAFGGDSVFEGLPDGWAERVKPGLWKVFGVDEPEDPGAFQVERWSDRERALIAAFGREFFFNVETGELATKFVEIPVATQYPVYLWDDAASELVIHEPDGSTRPANLVESPVSLASSEDTVDGPRSLSHLVIERMTELMGEVFADDDQLYWVEQHLQVLSELDDAWVDAFSVWLGEHVIAGILDANWAERDGRWLVSSSHGVFDPEPVVRATVGSESRGEHRVMVTAACAAMGIPLPNSG